MSTSYDSSINGTALSGTRGVLNKLQLLLLRPLCHSCPKPVRVLTRFAGCLEYGFNILFYTVCVREVLLNHDSLGSLQSLSHTVLSLFADARFPYFEQTKCKHV